MSARIEPGSPEWEQRVFAMAAREMEHPEQFFYLSFATDQEFRGAVVTCAHGPTTALMKVHRLGINPGGEVLTVPMDLAVDPAICDRLLSMNELVAAFGEMQRFQ